MRSQRTGVFACRTVGENTQKPCVTAWEKRGDAGGWAMQVAVHAAAKAVGFFPKRVADAGLWSKLQLRPPPAQRHHDRPYRSQTIVFVCPTKDAHTQRKIASGMGKSVDAFGKMEFASVKMLESTQKVDESAGRLSRLALLPQRLQAQPQSPFPLPILRYAYRIMAYHLARRIVNIMGRNVDAFGGKRFVAARIMECIRRPATSAGLHQRLRSRLDQGPRALQGGKLGAHLREEWLNDEWDLFGFF